MSTPPDTPPTDASSVKQDPNSAVAAMFGRIVGVYDPLNRLFSLGLDQHWRACLARTALLGMAHTATPHVLDAAAGTLDVSLKLCAARPDLRVTALDFCLPMLQSGAKKFHARRQTRTVSGTDSHLALVAGDARRLPLPDTSVHALTMAFGLRNITPRSEALAEMLRVLKPGGRACILEFSPPAKGLLRTLYRLYLERLLPAAGRLFSRDGAYRYLAESITAFPTPDELTREIKSMGFGRVYHVPLTSGIVRIHVCEKA